MSDETTDLHAAQEALNEARQRLAEVPAEVVVTNHAMGLYELAAIHLSNDPPDLDAARLAIDAVRALVEGLGDRLGDEADTLRAALSNIQMVFVSTARRRSEAGDASADAHAAAGAGGGDTSVAEKGGDGADTGTDRDDGQ